MSDPRRWLDPESDAPEGARELLQHAQRTRPIDRATLALSAAALAKLASLPGAAAALGLGIKLAAATSVVVVAGAVAVQLATPPQPIEAPSSPRRAASASTRSAAAAPQAPAPIVAVPPAAVEAALPTGMEPPAPQVSDAPRPPARPRVQRRVPSALPQSEPAAVPDPDVLALEVQQLDQARLLLASDPAAALARAEEHAARFPAAALAAERELIAVDALRRLGRHDQARARANALLARNPGSLYRARLRSLLADDPR